jgi:hypothetical protein
VQPLQLPPQLAPLLLGEEEPPATACAQTDMRRLILRLLQRGQVVFSAATVAVAARALLRSSFSKVTPHALQSYSKIGIPVAPMSNSAPALNQVYE